MDDDLEALKPAGHSPELARWNLEDLTEYKARLEAEITRIEAAIASKSSVQDLAAGLFKSS